MLNRSLQRSHNCELIRIEKNTSPADTFAFKSLFGLVGRGEPGQRALPSWHRPGLPKSLAAAPRRPFVTLRLVEVGVSSVGHMKAQMWELGVRLGRSSLEVGHGRALTRCFVAKRPSLVRSHPAPAWRRLLLLLRRHRDSLRPWTLGTANLRFSKLHGICSALLSGCNQWIVLRVCSIPTSGDDGRGSRVELRLHPCMSLKISTSSTSDRHSICSRQCRTIEYPKFPGRDAQVEHDS